MILGDAIDPEIVMAVQTVLDALGSLFAWDEEQAGMAAVGEADDPLDGRWLDSVHPFGWR